MKGKKGGEMILLIKKSSNQIALYDAKGKYNCCEKFSVFEELIKNTQEIINILLL